MRKSILFIAASLAVVLPLHAQEPVLSVRQDTETNEIIFEIGPLHLEANAGHGGVTQPKAHGRTSCRNLLV